MRKRWRLGEVGRTAPREVQRNVAFEGGLIAFDREVVVRLTRDEVLGQRALCQQRIGGDVPTRDIAVREQRDRHADFVGALEFVASGYRQRADFFWAWQRPDS